MKPFTEEHKQNMRKPHGPMSEEHKQKLRKPHGPLTEEQKVKRRKPRGLMTEEQKAKRKSPGPMSEEQKQKLRKPNSEEVKRIKKESQNKPETKIKRSLSIKAKWQDPEYRQTQMDGRNSASSKEKRSESKKKSWQDPEYRKNQLIAIGNDCQIKPNRPETLIDIITHEYWVGWKYTGDFSYWINGKNPDFVNEEQKLIIEVYGDYWHDGEDPTDRAEIFAQAGYEICVIWESELNNIDDVILKLRRFCDVNLY